jgi:hypothetical protein
MHKNSFSDISPVHPQQGVTLNPYKKNIPVSNITVKIKTEDTTIREDFLMYNTYSADYDDPVLNELVDCTLRRYAGELVDPDITITSKITWAKDVREKAK